jgi:hypothetical protein
MTHREKVARFVQEMDKRGVKRYNSAPPVWRLAWLLGIRLPPPHFLGFVANFLINAVAFGVPWALIMWLIVWRNERWPFALATAALAGVPFGLWMACYYRFSARRLVLPPWEDYYESLDSLTEDGDG